MIEMNQDKYGHQIFFLPKSLLLYCWLIKSLSFTKKHDGCLPYFKVN